MSYLERERAIIEELRVTARSVSLEEYDRHLVNRLGVALFDQVKAATAEIAERTVSVGEAAGLHHEQTYSHELGVLLLAGVARCVAGHSCQHAAVGDRPLHAVLSARVIACERCLPRFRGALVASRRQVRDGLDRLCDFCLQEPDTPNYRDVFVNFGPVMVGGSMCGDCWGRVHADASDSGGPL